MGAPKWPPKPPSARRAAAKPWRASTPPTLVAPRRSRGAPRFTDRLLLGHEHEVGGDRALAVVGIELRDQRAVARCADLHVQMRWAAGVAAGRHGLVAKGAVVAGPLRRAQLVVILAAAVGRPPLELRGPERRAVLRRAHDSADDESLAGGRALGRAGFVERTEHVRLRWRTRRRLRGRRGGHREREHERQHDASHARMVASRADHGGGAWRSGGRWIRDGAWPRSAW